MDDLYGGNAIQFNVSREIIHLNIYTFKLKTKRKPH